MSFMGTLTKVAMGFAAAKGLEQYQKMGGMAGVQSALAGNAGNMTDSLGDMAEKFGVPGGRKAVEEMMARFGMTGGGANAPAEMAGFGGLMAAMGSAAQAGAAPANQMFEAMAEKNPLTPMMEDNAKLMIRAMIQAAKADGEIDAEEKKKIIEALGAEASKEEIAFVKKQLDAPVDFAALAQDTHDQMKAQVYGMSLMAIRVDSTAEKTYLENLASALGLPDGTRKALHKSMGVPAG